MFLHADDDEDAAAEDVCVAVADADVGGSKRLERSKNEDWGNVDRFSSAMRNSGGAAVVLLLLLLPLLLLLWSELRSVGEGDAAPEADEAKG